MKFIFCLFCVLCTATNTQAQYALADGRGLERDLRLPQAPLRDPLFTYPRRHFPLTDGLGGQRFDDRYVRDGLRFAPEFTRGNSIYSRSLLFDYLGYTGWDLRSGRSPLMRPEERFDDIRNPQRPETSPQRIQAPRISNPALRSGPLNTRLDTRLPSNRIDTRIDPNDQTPYKSLIRENSRPNNLRSPRVESEQEIHERSQDLQNEFNSPNPPQLSTAHLSREQVAEMMVKVVDLRTRRRLEEKKVFGDIQDRDLSETFWENRGLASGRAMTLIGLSPSMRLELQLMKLKTDQLIEEAELLLKLGKGEPAFLRGKLEALKNTLNKEARRNDLTHPSSDSAKAYTQRPE